MKADRKLTRKQREAAVDLFEQGYGEYSVAKELGFHVTLSIVCLTAD